jgi:protein-L-isoaspartate(D-aspartate) O-methyltransferase
MLTDDLMAQKILKTKQIIEAFQKVDRKDFVLPEYYDEAYGDYPLPIGFGQTISQPTTVAIMLEFLSPKKNEKILDVGSGSGWTTALLAHIVGTEGKVRGVEIIPELVIFGRHNLSKYGFPWARILPAGKEIGLPEEAPFDKIMVSASAKELPDKLVSQLKKGGTMVIPVLDTLYKVRKLSDGKLKIQSLPGFSFVPLV